MVGHDVQKETHPVSLQFSNQRFEILLRPQLGVKTGWIRHIVAMGATLSSFKDGRGVKVRDAQPMKIGYQCPSVLKAESTIELKSIGGNGYS